MIQHCKEQHTYSRWDYYLFSTIPALSISSREEIQETAEHGHKGERAVPLIGCDERVTKLAMFKEKY
jgi:hypothetical protein